MERDQALYAKACPKQKGVSCLRRTILDRQHSALFCGDNTSDTVEDSPKFICGELGPENRVISMQVRSGFGKEAFWILI
jgi:hypothetical protein